MLNLIDTNGNPYVGIIDAVNNSLNDNVPRRTPNFSKSLEVGSAVKSPFAEDNDVTIETITPHDLTVGSCFFIFGSKLDNHIVLEEGFIIQTEYPHNLVPEQLPIKIEVSKNGNVWEVEVLQYIDQKALRISSDMPIDTAYTPSSINGSFSVKEVISPSTFKYVNEGHFQEFVGTHTGGQIRVPNIYSISSEEEAQDKISASRNDESGNFIMVMPSPNISPNRGSHLKTDLNVESSPATDNSNYALSEVIVIMVVTLADIKEKVRTVSWLKDIGINVLLDSLSGLQIQSPIDDQMFSLGFDSCNFVDTDSQAHVMMQTRFSYQQLLGRANIPSIEGSPLLEITYDTKGRT